MIKYIIPELLEFQKQTRGYAQPCVAPAARLRIGAVIRWHGKFSRNLN